MSELEILKFTEGVTYTTEEEMAKLNQQRQQENVEALRQGWGLPPRHHKAKWAELDKPGPWLTTYRGLEQRFGKDGVMFAFVGGRGNGKTQMAAQLMKHATKASRSAHYTTAMNLFMRIKATWDEQAKESEAQVVASYSKPSLLVVDEYGKRPEKEWQDQLLFHILDQRYGLMKDTILIDNRSPSEFNAAVGPSLIDRINEGGGVVEFAWGSFRK